jgi:hypothetical protein
MCATPDTWIGRYRDHALIPHERFLLPVSISWLDRLKILNKVRKTGGKVVDIEATDEEKARRLQPATKRYSKTPGSRWKS